MRCRWWSGGDATVPTISAAAAVQSLARGRRQVPQPQILFLSWAGSWVGPVCNRTMYRLLATITSILPLHVSLPQLHYNNASVRTSRRTSALHSVSCVCACTPRTSSRRHASARFCISRSDAGPAPPDCARGLLAPSPAFHTYPMCKPNQLLRHPDATFVIFVRR
jgi:hypothetical protein